MQEFRLRECAADFAEEGHDLCVAQPAPGRQTDLESAEAAIVGVLQFLKHNRGRHANQTDHRVDVLATRLVIENIDDLPELRVIDRITLTAVPKMYR